MENVLNIAKRLVEAADQTFSCTEARKRQFAEDTGRSVLRDQGREEQIPQLLEALDRLYSQRRPKNPVKVSRECLKSLGEKLSELHRRRKVVYTTVTRPVVALTLNRRYRRQDKNGVLLTS